MVHSRSGTCGSPCGDVLLVVVLLSLVLHKSVVASSEDVEVVDGISHAEHTVVASRKEDK